MLSKVRELSGADYIFCEQDAPEKMDIAGLARDFAASGITAEDRIQWWRRRGFARLDMDYVQPPLSPGKEAAGGMSLNVCPGAADIPTEIIEEHLRRFFYISVLKKRRGTDTKAEELLAAVRSIGGTIPVLN